jgi:hypothetical protein
MLCKEIMFGCNEKCTECVNSLHKKMSQSVVQDGVT